MGAEESWASGMSTYVLGTYAFRRSGKLFTIDRNKPASVVAYEWTRVFGDTVHCHCGDSLEALQQFPERSIHLLYLDAGDPLEEWKVALPALAHNALVLINDAQRVSSDSLEVARNHGWHVLHHDTQLLLSRAEEP
jgi:predicted O-methyltransferase YrrM